MYQSAVLCCGIERSVHQLVLNRTVAQLDLPFSTQRPALSHCWPFHSTWLLQLYLSLSATCSTSAFPRATRAWLALSNRPMPRGLASTSTAVCALSPKSWECHTTRATSTSTCTRAACSDVNWYARSDWLHAVHATSKPLPHDVATLSQSSKYIKYISSIGMTAKLTDRLLRYLTVRGKCSP